MLKELIDKEIAFLAGGEKDTMFGATISSLTFNYPKTLERSKAVYPSDTDKMLNEEALRFTLELYSLNSDKILKADKCGHMTSEFSMSKAEYHEFCDSYEYYCNLDPKTDKSYFRRRFPGIRNIFSIDALKSQEKLFDIEYIFSNEIFKYIHKNSYNQVEKFSYILIPYTCALREQLSFSKAYIKGFLLLEVDKTYDFKNIYRKKTEKLELTARESDDIQFDDENPVADISEPPKYKFNMDRFLEK
jgi:hypothetical protein